MTNAIERLKELVRLGEKATSGACEHAVLGSLKHSGHMGMTEYSEYVKKCLTMSGEETGETKIHYVRTEKPDGPADVAHLGNGPTSAQNAAFFAAAANARPDIAKLLEVAEAARELRRIELQRQRDEDDSCAAGATYNVQVWAEAEARLDAALRNLETKETEDA